MTCAANWHLCLWLLLVLSYLLANRHHRQSSSKLLSNRVCRGCAVHLSNWEQRIKFVTLADKCSNHIKHIRRKSVCSAIQFRFLRQFIKRALKKERKTFTWVTPIPKARVHIKVIWKLVKVWIQSNSFALVWMKSKRRGGSLAWLFTAAHTNITSGCGIRCRKRWAQSCIFKPWMFWQNSPVRLINHSQCTLRVERGQ